MKIKSWPLPPLKALHKQPNSLPDEFVNVVPIIPDEFRIFGIDYLYKDNKSIPKDIDNTNFNKEIIIELVKDSYSKYLKILNDYQAEDVEKINQIHLKINEELNKCKEMEVEFELKRLKNEKNRKINNMIEGLEHLMN